MLTEKENIIFLLQNR